MAKVIRQSRHVAAKGRNCYLCGHHIRVGDGYLAVTFSGVPHDGWTGLRFAKVCQHCAPRDLCTCGDCDFVVPAEPAERIPDYLAEPRPDGLEGDHAAR